MPPAFATAHNRRFLGSPSAIYVGLKPCFAIADPRRRTIAKASGQGYGRSAAWRHSSSGLWLFVGIAVLAKTIAHGGRLLCGWILIAWGAWFSLRLLFYAVPCHLL